jgi:hypothetical protein
MNDRDLPIACDLSRLDEAQRAREKELLARFRRQLVKESETDRGVWFSVAADPETLSSLGELLGLERLCCPFLTFQLEVSADSCRLYISGQAAAKDLILAEFTIEK